MVTCTDRQPLMAWLAQGLLVASNCPIPVIGVETVDDLVAVARQTAARNGHSDRVRVVHAMSTTLRRSQLPPVCLFVAELLDTGFIGEGLIRSMRHATKELTTPGVPFHCIPSSGQVFAEVVESATLMQMHRLMSGTGEGVQPRVA